MRQIVSIFFCLAMVLTGLLQVSVLLAAGPSAQAAFERLKSLSGNWRGASSEDPNAKLEVSYKVTAGGSAVVETEFAGLPHEMVTVYHLDGEKLIMTHYCAVGNQPTLQFDSNRSSGNEIFFDFASGSNMDPATDLHIHSGRFHWTAEDTVDSEWVAYKDGRPDHTTKFSLQRVKD